MINTRRQVLDEIAAHKRLELERCKQSRPLESFIEDCRPAEGGLLEAAFRMPQPNTKLMLEIKPSSPSAGVLAVDLNLPEVLAAYNRAGVSISVLTDERYFGGSLGLLSEVAQQSTHPVLRKDFILDPYQVYEARHAGASAVLLIVKMLNDRELTELTALVRQLGMTPLIEIQNSHELERALTVEPTILLMNNRDLQTLSMDLDTTSRLSGEIPAGIIRISASGIESRADIERLQPYCDGFLVGSVLMRQPAGQLADKLRELTGP
ncbi:MAG TPA: indole-3-glycerol phosphate synthase TrpC [Coleofasciculaceae cyanobacterium]